MQFTLHHRMRLAFGIVLTVLLPLAVSVRADNSTSFIRQELSEAGPAAVRGGNDVQHFYALRNYRPAWNARDAALALKVLAEADREGLDPADYRFDVRANSSDSRETARWDLRLSEKFLGYARDVRTGRLAPGAVYVDADLIAQTFDASAALNSALTTGNLAHFISDLPPQRVEYIFLRGTLSLYRNIQARGGWQPLPNLEGPLSALPAPMQLHLQQRLALEDADIGSPLGELSVSDLEAALRRFQARHGLEADGRLGSRSIEALNISAVFRVAQIEANMERWRWLPHTPEGRYVAVNAADASLVVVENGKTVLTSPIVVGKPATPTPILATKIVAVTANPPWNVPQSIAGKEILPKLVHNPSYLVAQNMVLRNGPPGDPHGLSVSWSSVSREHFPYLIQQLPGVKNSLGVLKMEMPNRFDVYLHDTPAKSLFAQSERFFSHGCVRVREVGALAKYALTGDPTADVARIVHPIDEKTQRLSLAEPLPVYILYWTAFKNEDGSVGFRRDVYGRDTQLIAALNGNRVASLEVKLQTDCSA